MGARVVVIIEGLEETLSRLTQIEEKAHQNLERQTKELAKGTERAWKEATPRGRSSENRKTPHLQDEDRAEPAGMSFTLENNVYYYKFVDEGHNTPAGWNRRTKHGIVYREAKRRSHVKGREMTKKAIEFVEQNAAPQYLSKFLDNV